jgi:MYXO-CTERM domain-containing protein
MKRATVAMMICGACLCTAAHADLVVNGDFETGGIAPSTTAYASTDIYAPAQYIITNYDTVHSAWVDFFDHTFGTAAGHYMVVNGTDNGTGPTWAQVVAVQPNTEYTLSGWFASLYPASIAWLEFRVDGAIVNPAFQAPGTLGVWEQRSVTFTTGPATTSISLEIWDSNQAFTGNDYAIDDISLTPTPGAAALLGVGCLASARRRRP